MTFSIFLFFKQRQEVERAKLALLTNKRDESSDPNDSYRQSDHLLMMVAYKNWEKILQEVSCIFVHSSSHRHSHFCMCV